MAATKRSTRSQSKTATLTKNVSKKAKETKKTPRSKGLVQESDVESGVQEEAATSVYFEKEYDSEAVDDDSDVPKKKKRSTSTRNSAKKSQTPVKKRKIDQDEDDAYKESETDTRPGKRDKVYDSDALDEESDYEVVKGKKRGKRVANSSPKKGPQSPRKKKARAEAELDDEFVDDGELKEGQEVVGVVVQPPKTGRVPPGQISQNTLDFLTQLKDPACNDREWFRLHEPVYRVAEKEWKDFVEAFTDVLAEVDPQIPHLPPKDVIHRIYRDIRFSNDKTPYKLGVSASFSRSGRKGIFAGYHIAVKPGNESLIAAGSWCPGRNELATIRTNIQRSSRRLRNAISAPEFVKFFGEASPHPKGNRQNIFGMDDELKVAPKGVAKDDKDIDLLKCRSFAVVHRFTDSEVLSPDFKDAIASVARVMQPFVHCLNNMMTVTQDDDDDDEEEEEEDNENEDGNQADE